MKIAVSAAAQDLSAPIDPRFGRCAYFIVVDTDDMDFDVFENESVSLGGGAGIQSAQFVASKGAEVVITGHAGPNAMRTLTAAGLDVILGQTGTVQEAVEDYKSGKLRSSSEPNVSDHFGMGGGDTASWGRFGASGGGMGRGMGRGMGGGGGRRGRKGR
jgi:predicted Fe-Mo cluster-binding NifX family protein